MKVGILIISTGRYDVFVGPLLESINKYFLTNHEKQIYHFSDQYNVDNFFVPHLPFPGPTLCRYQWFVQYRQAIDADVLYYLDVDMRIVAPVGDEILPDETGLVATRHPGFWNGGWGDVGTTKRSTAYVPKAERRAYYCGGFQGGTRSAYLDAAEEMARNINEDKKRGVVATWADESHWNKYLTSHSFKELSPSYCFPEAEWAKGLPFDKKIIALDKDHKALRS